MSLKEKKVLKRCPWGTILKNGAFFSKKGTILVPLRYQNEVVPPDKRALSLKEHYFSALLALFLYRKCMGKQCPFGKWHQNGAQKGTILRTINWCPKGTVLVPLIFLSAVACWQQYVSSYIAQDTYTVKHLG